MARQTGKRIGLWLILGLLFVGLIGFGTTNLTGGASRIGRVGDQEITVNDYAQALTQQIRAFEAQIGQPLPFTQAQAFGLDQAVLAQLVSAKALDQEAAELGISAGDERVARAVLDVPAFQGLSGEFDREAYRQTLQANNMTEASFEEGLRQEFARSLLQQAVLDGVPAPEAYVEALASYAGETRTLTWAPVGPEALAEEIPVPDAAALQAQYDDNPERYTAPEERRISYAWVTPEMIQDEVTVDDDAVRDLYDDRIDEFVQPERRLVERLVYPDAEAAEAAKARLDAGETEFETLVEERGLDLSDVDMGDVAPEQLGAAAEPVFAAAPGDVIGPVETDLGPALFRMNAVLAAQETPFEEVRDDLRAELATTRARRVIDEARTRIEDLIAGGAAIEDLASETMLEADTIAWSEGETGGIADYEIFREAAAALEPGAFPELVELPDGGLFVLRLDEVVPPALRPFEEVAVQVTDDAVAAATQAAVTALAQEKAEAIAGGASFAEVGLDPREEQEVGRRNFIEGTPQDFLTTLFAMEEGEVRAVPNGPGAIVVRLDSVNEADMQSADVQANLEAVAERAAAGIAQDLFTAYSAAVQSGTEIRIDDSAIAAVNAQFR